MSKPVNKTAIGIFVVVAIALIVGGIIVIGSGKFFKDNQKFVLVFEGSVKGLAVGSPVVFRGVKVGDVTDIRMRYMPKDKSILIPVVVELGEGKMQGMDEVRTAMGGGSRKQIQRKFVEEMIKQGLRAQLEMQSIVTGQLQIALDLYPDKPAKFIGGVPPEFVEIPTIQTNLQELAEKVGKIPFEEIFNKLRAVAEGIDRTVNSPEMTRLVKSMAQGAENGNVLIENINREVQPLASAIKETTQEIKTMAKQAGTQIEPLAASLQKTSDEVTATLKKAQTAIDNMENLTGDDSAIAYKLTKTLSELELAARSMRVLTETLEHQPESVIFGKKQMRRN